MRGWVVSLAAFGFVLGGPYIAAAQSKKSVEALDGPPIHAFSVTLVVGEMQGASTPDNLPLGARKALTDMRDFLPYKSFRLLDTQFIRCCAAIQPEQVKGRLRGVDDQPYAFVIAVDYPGKTLSIHFSLQESAAKGFPSSKGELLLGDDPLKEERKALETRDALQRSRQVIESNRQRLNGQQTLVQELSLRLRQLRANKSTRPEQVDEIQRAVSYAQSEIAQLQKTLAWQEPEARELELKLTQMEQSRANAAQQRQSEAMSPSKSAVIDSTFAMDIGETVVIGTSSLKGDKALIALLTAVRRPDAAQGAKK
jgi:hypothetical protein